MKPINCVCWDSGCLKIKHYPYNISYAGTKSITGYPFSPYRTVFILDQGLTPEKLF